MSNELPEIEIVSPPHRRPGDDPKPVECPDVETLSDIYKKCSAGEMPTGELREFGFRPWNEPGLDEFGEDPFDGHVLWLVPGERYDGLPDGFTFTSIFGKLEIFVGGFTDNDIRFGCLSFGLLRAE